MPLPCSRPLALVTSASSGIGLELANQFASKGYDLILVASDSVQLARVADQLRATDGTPQVACIPADLSTYAGVEALYKALCDTGRALDVLVANADLDSTHQVAPDGRLEAELALINLNVTALVHLVERLVVSMVVHGTGKVLITSAISPSTATSQPCHAVCAATKAFLRSFGLGLRNELQEVGIAVTVLMPGPLDGLAFAQSAFASLEDEDRMIPALLSRLQAQIPNRSKPGG
jgi:short-subunit dehydrogenase